eukprot:Gregarina_sp_Poly_1__2480@NODE_1671_length_3563_cov_30_178776_g1097_i0_p1_GENE_NODE_1671_length_3563_cov_30_178776_g1097_i0NODE_1671_length_3563_cov_30_178776_g1097_i0_p1_ORF_typecomplete_len235_score16_65_NODE_1671_length_3563_cov_30_178776_g1097_i06071311
MRKIRRVFDAAFLPRICRVLAVGMMVQWILQMSALTAPARPEGKLVMNSSFMNATYPALHLPCQSIVTTLVSHLHSEQALRDLSSENDCDNLELDDSDDDIWIEVDIDEGYSEYYVPVEDDLVPLQAFIMIVSAYIWCSCLHSVEPLDSSPQTRHCGDWCSRQISSCRKFWTACPTPIELSYCWATGYWEDRSCSIAEWTSSESSSIVRDRAASCVLDAVMWSGPVYYGPFPPI